MVFEGEPFAHELDFSTGLPLGAVVYSLLGNDGTVITGFDGLSVDPDDNAISYLLVIPGTANTVNTPLYEQRTLIWNYTTNDGLVNGRVRYRVEKPIPFPVTPKGVRDKLGILEHEVRDDQIDLLRAYATFAEQVSEGDLSSFESGGNLAEIKITDAIEALAALRLLDTLQVAIAKSEDSGTNAYVRYGTIDWEAIRMGLTTTVAEGANLVVVPSNDLESYTFFVAVQRDDPVTGETS